MGKLNGSNLKKGEGGGLAAWHLLSRQAASLALGGGTLLLVGRGSGDSAARGLFFILAAEGSVMAGTAPSDLAVHLVAVGFVVIHGVVLFRRLVLLHPVVLQ